ncbi:M20 family metallopeptidase [Acidaminococcus sp. NSJ-142]|uniref:M20 family metallopeptidase n=1 Tax=Acidaminococcus hominis TaxID=2897706 RepID=UPI001E3D2F3E|nr:M20 family metallopeptidase [Acidaminococcus hominis]
MKNIRLYSACEKLLPEYLKLWQKVVNVDCGSRNGKGIARVADYLEEELRPLRPDSLERIPMANPEDGSHLLVTFKGKGKGKIMACAHLDTVFPVGTAAERPFRIDGDWAKGPGAADCKSGVLMMVFALKLLRQFKYTDFDTITLLFNADEEISSPDSRHLIAKLAPQHDCFLCCESGQEGDGLVSSRKGASRILVNVKGIASHAGNAPDKGANALMECLRQIEGIKALEAPARGTTINFTVIHSGDADNVIPAEAHAIADLRVTDPQELERVQKAVEVLAFRASIPGTSVDTQVGIGSLPFPSNPGTRELTALAQEIYGELGRKLVLRDVGGSSDANWAAAAGAVCVDGFGAVKGGKNHTPQECALVPSVVPRMYLLTRMLEELGHAPRLIK